MSESVPEQVRDFLATPTPAAWVGAAAADLPLLLNDHANCEKKAAATALSLVFRYAIDTELCLRMSKLAREELRHYEQVIGLMRQLDVRRQALSASRYARELRATVRTTEPGRLVDTLIVGAFIEARSCERFALLAPALDEQLGKFYAALLASEARHFRNYLELARSRAGGDDIDTRVAEIGRLEGRLATGPDSMLRFHSGPPDHVATQARVAAGP